MSTKTKSGVVELVEPIRRNGKDDKSKVTSITLRKPKSGELRGTRLSDILTMDVDTMITIIPRISEPVITEADLINMDPADLTNLSLEVLDFFGDKSASRSV